MTAAGARPGAGSTPFHLQWADRLSLFSLVMFYTKN